MAAVALFISGCSELLVGASEASDAADTEDDDESAGSTGERPDGSGSGAVQGSEGEGEAADTDRGTSGPGSQSGVVTSTSTSTSESGTEPALTGDTSGGTPAGSEDTGDTGDVTGDSEAGTSEGHPYDSPCPREETEKHKDIVREGITRVMIEGGASREVIDNYWGGEYIQHNPIAPNGVDTFASFFENAAPNTYTMSRLIGECDKVVIHGRYGTGATFDMLRVDPELERMVEHWDAGGGSLDGDVEVRDLELTGPNREVVLSFITDVLIGGAVESASLYIAQDMVEHGGGAGGLEGFVQRIMSESMSYTMIHHQVAEGNFVFTLSEGYANNAHLGFHDLFRVEDGMIVEHWVASLGVQAGQSGEGIF